MPILLTPQPDRKIQFHPFANGGVLHLKGSHRLWVLNVTAATLWCLLDGQADAHDLALAYGKRFGINQTAAQQDVMALIAQFEQWGLLNDGNPRGPKADIAEQPPERQQTETISTADTAGLERMAFALAGHCFAVAIADENLAKDWRALFQHLEIETQPTDSYKELVVLKKDKVKDKENSHTLYGCENGACAEIGLAKNEVIPWLIHKLFDLGMAGQNHRLLFHAAVVAKHGRALLLPAASGSGKSTLAAALAASGWAYLSDELAVVDSKNLCVESFAMPIGLKDKSMAALAGFIPGVADLPRHIRADGIGLRYVTPPGAASEGGLPIHALVFPRYSSNSTTRSAALRPLESLEKLAPTGSSARPLASRDVAAILQLASLPGYRLEFSDLEAALKLLEGLLAT